jgi:hypothetical protein
MPDMSQFTCNDRYALLSLVPQHVSEPCCCGLLLTCSQARDLAALCCTCRELRYLAAEDFLWRPLFYKEFPRASVAERNEAELRGFKGAYAKRVLVGVRGGAVDDVASSACLACHQEGIEHT